MAFLAVAVWWLVFSFPLLRRVAEPPAALRGKLGGNPISTSLRLLGSTFREFRRYRHAGIMLVAYLAYNDGIPSTGCTSPLWAETKSALPSWVRTSGVRR